MVPSRGHCVTAAQAWRPWIKIKRSRRDNTTYLITSIYSYVSQNVSKSVSKIALFCVLNWHKKTLYFLRKMNTRICFVRMAKSRLEWAPRKSMTARQSGLYREIQVTRKSSRGRRGVSTGILGPDNGGSLDRCWSGKREFVRNEWSYALRVDVCLLKQSVFSRTI